MPGSVVVSSARTPIGKLSGALASLPGTDLGAHAIRAALARAGISGEQVDYVLLGQVLQAGAGQMPARQAAVKGGIPMSVPSMLINKVCLSGIDAIYLADQMIQAGDADVVVAGGMESMTQRPYLLPNAREGYRMDHGQLVDSMIGDGLWCAFDAVHMGAGTERYTSEMGGITREMQDEFAAQSHERAAAAIKDGRLAEEIEPIEIPQRRGDPVLVDTDEGVRPGTTAESLGKLRPAFAPDGTITAGNASQISDGGAALVVTSVEAAERLGLTPLAELVSFGMVAGPDTSLLTQPSRAIVRALDKVDRQVTDLDLVEINEAFAAVAIASMQRSRHRRRHRQRERWRDRARVTRSARRAHAWCSPSSTSCVDAAAVSARRRCAAAAGRAKPPSCARCTAPRRVRRVSRARTRTLSGSLPRVQAQVGSRSRPARCGGPAPRCSRVAVAQPLVAHGAGGVPCPLRSLTGIPCPFCGMTRGVTAAVRGDVADAALFNPGSVLLVVAAVLLLGMWRIRRVTIPDLAADRDDRRALGLRVVQVPVRPPALIPVHRRKEAP